MGINKKFVINILMISVISSMIGGVDCYANEVTSITTTAPTEIIENNSTPTIIKKLDFEHDLQDVLDTYKNLKEAEKIQAKSNTISLLEEIANSNKYSIEEKKAISQETITTAIINSIFEKSEGLKLLSDLNQQVDKHHNTQNLNNTIDNILKSNISITSKENFCKNALILAKANKTISEDEYNKRISSLNDNISKLQQEENDRIAKERAEQLAKEELAKKEQEARKEAERKAQELAEQQAKERELAQQQEQAEQEKINQNNAVQQVQQTIDTTNNVDTSNLQQIDNTSQDQYYDGFAGTLQYTDRDFLALCNAVQHEVGNCSAQSKKMVASVIINRALSGRFPSSMYDVIVQPNQFTGISSYVSRTDYASDDTKYWCQYVLDNGVDYSNGALFYYAPQWCGYMSYFENMSLVGECDGQRYFKP